MPSVGAASSSTHPEDHAIPILSFDQLSQDPADGEGHQPDDSDAHGAASRGDETLADVTPAIMATDTRAVSKRRLYLMVSADFGLSFTWLCKFAVAT